MTPMVLSSVCQINATNHAEMFQQLLFVWCWFAAYITVWRRKMLCFGELFQIALQLLTVVVWHFPHGWWVIRAITATKYCNCPFPQMCNEILFWLCSRTNIETNFLQVFKNKWTGFMVCFCSSVFHMCFSTADKGYNTRSMLHRCTYYTSGHIEAHNQVQFHKLGFFWCN